MAQNDRFIELYLKKANARVYVLLPRVVIELIFARKCDKNYKHELYMMSFSHLNDIGEWFETVGNLYFYKLRCGTHTVTLQKRLCRIYTEFCTYDEILMYVKTYPGISKYLPGFISRLIKNAYTARLFDKLCQGKLCKQNSKNIYTDKNQSSYFKLV